MIRHYSGADGAYLGAFSDCSPLVEATERPAPPHSMARWDGNGWIVKDDDLLPYLEAQRATMFCSRMQGVLALGEDRWAKVLEYRANATWAEKVIIDDAGNWFRNSENIQFFGYLLGLTAVEMDDLFASAARITE